MEFISRCKGLVLLLSEEFYMCDSTYQDVEALRKNKDSGIGKVVEEAPWLKKSADEAWLRDQTYPHGVNPSL